MGATTGMAWRIGQGDLLAGGAASAALAVLVFWVELAPVLAVPLAVLIYAAVVLLHLPLGAVRPHAEEVVARVDPDEGAAYAAALANAAEIRDLGTELPVGPVRDRVVRLADRIDRTLVVMRAGGNLAAAPAYNDHLLGVLLPELAEYARHTDRGADGAREATARFEDVICPWADRAVDEALARLDHGHVVDLDVFSETLASYRRGIAPPPGPAPIASSDAPALPEAEAPASGSPEPGALDLPESPTLPVPSTRAAGPVAPHVDAARRFGLTRREHEIVILISLSHPTMTNPEVATELCISFRTVENHVASILAKLGLKSRREIPAFAAKHGLLPPTAPTPAPE